MSSNYIFSACVFQLFDHMLVAIEDISGQIGHNYMRDKYVNNFDHSNCKISCLNEVTIVSNLSNLCVKVE